MMVVPVFVGLVSNFEANPVSAKMKLKRHRMRLSAGKPNEKIKYDVGPCTTFPFRPPCCFENITAPLPIGCCCCCTGRPTARLETNQGQYYIGSIQGGQHYNVRIILNNTIFFYPTRFFPFILVQFFFFLILRSD